MFRFDKKGQSSSVFNLLIAALVSLAILGLLLAILGGVGGIGGNKPDETAAKLLKNASQKPAMPYSDKATFTKKDNTISALALSKDLTTGSEQIVIKNCSSTPFESNEGKLVRYNGSADKEVQLYGICDDEILTEDNSGIPKDCGPLNVDDGLFTCFLIITNKTS